MAKIMIVAGLASSLLRFRGDLIKSWQDLGHQVVAVAPGERLRSVLNELGVEYYNVKLKRSGLNPLADLALCFNIFKIIAREKPQYIFLYTVKPVIYGSLAAYLFRSARVYSMITGLGYVFRSRTGGRSLLKSLLVMLYRLALARNEKVFFQNLDDSGELLALKAVKTGQVVQIHGSGVNLEYFKDVPLPENKFSFLMIARLLKEKGFYEYVEAARFVKQKYPGADFKMIGWLIDDTPSSVSRSDLESWKEEGIVGIYDKKDDVRPFIAGSAVFVLPSYYGEGKPRTILEAMAMGRPVITTDSPGCRETVIDGVNGFIAPVNDSKALAAAMEKFIENPEIIEKMGRESRKIAEDIYDVHKVNRSINDIMFQG